MIACRKRFIDVIQGDRNINFLSILALEERKIVKILPKSLAKYQGVLLAYLFFIGKIIFLDGKSTS